MLSDLFNNLIKFSKLFISIIFLAHWMACLFYLISREDSSEKRETWIVVFNVVNRSLYDKYVTSLYWAITTMITVRQLSKHRWDMGISTHVQ